MQKADSASRHLNAAGYDIVGDVHGCAQTLSRLLEQLGYKKRNGVFHHPGRRAIFVGDILDRGPRIREAMALVREMVEAGSAELILGNHELNALAYCTPHPGKPGAYIRPHTERNTHIISETLEQFANYQNDWQDHLRWLLTLPLYRDYGHFRVAHACWDADAIAGHEAEGLPAHIAGWGLEALAADPGSTSARMIRRLTTGLELSLPGDSEMLTAEGFKRRTFRARFWMESPETYGDLAFQPDPIPADIANRTLTTADRAALVVYHRREPPLFVGHYWLTGKPRPVAANVACLDYSAVKFGRLVAYRMDRETRLESRKFNWVYVDP